MDWKIKSHLLWEQCTSSRKCFGNGYNKGCTKFWKTGSNEQVDKYYEDFLDSYVKDVIYFLEKGWRKSIEVKREHSKTTAFLKYSLTTSQELFT